MALALAARADTPTLVLHTDVLKVTLRAADRYPRGPAWAGDLADRLARVRPFLDAQARKARADGYRLVIEGTLAIGFGADRVVRLEATEVVRAARIARKPPASRRALAHADLAPLARALAGARADLVLDASAPLGTLVQRVEAAWRTNSSDSGGPRT